MKKIKFIDRGIDEQIEVDGENLGGVDHLTTRQLLEKLENKGIFSLEVVNFDEYSKNK